MNKEPRDFYHGNVLIAKFIPSLHSCEKGLSFYSAPEDRIQVGTWNYDADQILHPHIHNFVGRVVDRTSEVLFVISGSLHADLYGEDSSLVGELELNEGDMLICLNGGHGYRILAPRTRVLEIKNGPYPGVELDRTRIESLCSESAIFGV